MESACLHIVVVDDEESVRVGLGRMLRWTGMQVETFGSGEEFLASSLRPDCVVLDLHMPGMSGIDIQARLAAMEPPVPVVIVTGHDTPENRESALSAGACAYLLKPVAGKTLVGAITTAVSKQSVRTET